MFEHNEDLFLTRTEFDAGVFGRANPPSFPAGPQVAVTKAISVAWLCRLRVTCLQVCELGEGEECEPCDGTIQEAGLDVSITSCSSSWPEWA